MKPQKNALYLGVGFALLTFVLFYIGVAIALKNDITFKNYVAYGVFSLLVGVIVGIFASLKSKLGLIIFIIAFGVAFGTMIYTFNSDLSGWQDLAGLLQMMMVLGLGLVLATAAEVTVHFVRKSKQNKLNHP